jgi:hypothetical protein
MQSTRSSWRGQREEDMQLGTLKNPFRPPKEMKDKRTRVEMHNGFVLGYRAYEGQQDGCCSDAAIFRKEPLPSFAFVTCCRIKLRT